MLALHTRQAAAVTRSEQDLYQRQLDALVYELYGLTEEEIMIVET